MPVDYKAKNLWDTAIKSVKGKADIAKVRAALKQLINQKSGNVAWLADARELAKAIDGIKEKRQLQFAAAIKTLRDELEPEIGVVEKEVAREEEVVVQDWLDEWLPEKINPEKDPFGVVKETAQLRKWRRYCFWEELKGRGLLAPRREKRWQLDSAVRAGFEPEGGLQYWKPGSRCHCYTEIMHKAYSGVHKKLKVDLRDTLQGQKDAYIARVFRNIVAKEDEDCIEHSYLIAAGGVAHDGTYHQFFAKTVQGWRNLPPVFSGTEIQFEALFPMCKKFGSGDEKWP